MTTPVPITSRTGMFRGNSVQPQTVIDLQGLITAAATQVATTGANATAAAASAASAATQLTNVSAAATSGVANINAAVTSGQAQVQTAANGVNSSVTTAVAASTAASGSATSATASATAAAGSATAASTSATAAAGSATAASTSATNAGSSATAAANSATSAANAAALLTSSSNIPSSATPLMDGTAAVGTSGNYARGDHVHPSDTSRAPVANAALTGSTTAVTLAVSSALTLGGVGVATTAVVPVASSTTPAINGTAAIGTGTTWARADHVHPTDTTRAALASPNFSGTPQLAGVALATQSYVTGLASSTTPAVDGTAAVGTSTNYARADHVHGTDTSRAPVASPTFTGTVTLPADPTAALQASTKQYVDNRQPSFRNVLHNAQFRVNQRNPGTITANNGYPADRWQHSDDGTGSRSVVAFALADADRTAIGDEDARVALSITTNGGAGAGAFDLLAHKIEGVRTLAGKTVTLSFWAAASVASSVGIEMIQAFGTGGSPSGTVTGIAATKLAVTTSWVRYTTTFTVPSLSATGKIVGTNGDDFLGLYIYTSAGTTYSARTGSMPVQTGITTYLWGVQLEAGSVATPLEKVPMAIDLHNCQRFYQGPLQCAMDGYNVTGADVSGLLPITVPMRAIPTSTVTANVSSNVGTPVLQVLQGGWGSIFIHAPVTATGSAFLNVTYTLAAEL